nr:B-cell receptor CD22-like [Danio rerio]|eukprot:XP_021333826.1 B-cell receptor CD22-like [Danio rerio]
MLMWLRMAPALHLIFLLIIHRVSAAGWGVNYSPSQICALQNSSVTISCTFTYPTTGYQIMKVFWNKDLVKNGGEFADLSEDPEYSQRLQYLGDKKQNCTIRLSHVTKNDEHEYYFRITTNVTGGRIIGIPGVHLNVTDLQLESPERVTEGDSVRLTCKRSCNLTDTPTFIWYRNSEILTTGTTGDKLILDPVRGEDAGRYRCAVLGNTLASPDVYLNVTYPPNNVSVSINGSAVIVKGDSVSLICSSNSNPPALNFSWFKGETSVGSGRIFNISKISSDDSGEYKCRARNDLGEKYSAPVTLDVQYPPRNVSISIRRSAVIMSGDSVTLNCSSDSNPPALFSWFKGTTYVGSGRIFNILNISSDDSGEYKCKAKNEHGVKYSDPVTLDAQYPPRNISVSISGPAVIMSGDSVTLSCSSDSNPPALNFSWFKGDTSVGSGRIFSISKISSDDSGEYKCRAKNDHGEKYSDPVTLDVQYAPRNISVSISGSAVIMSGDSVTLNCSSDSNPPAEINWFKGETFVGSGRIFNISKISSDDSGEYKCRARNEHGEEYSDPVTLDVQSVTQTLPPAEISWFKGETSVGSGRFFNISKISSDDSGEYKCRARNAHGEKYSDPVTLDVQYPPRNISVSVSGSHVVMSGDSVSLNCSSDSNPPAEISWFKEESFVGSGRIFNIPKISSDDSGEYKCRARNEHGEQYSDPVTLDVQCEFMNVQLLKLTKAVFESI